ncbi:MAG: UDP-N-acetylglucosamine pyrophosphorylase [Lachnospiraceae bacterium]|nr:UDP-N-acetylglucosamine pyrophosphorylase [Lachnospiraceae bacterium]
MDKLTIKELFDTSNTIASEIFEGKTYPWEVLPFIGDFIIKLSQTLPADEYDNPSEGVYIHKTAKIAPTASITGPCIICKDAELRQCAFVRGKAIIGEGAVLGNSCEIKNAILFNKVQVPHFNYIGDSVLGFKAHTGAGAVTSNVKQDKTLVTVLYEGKRIETGLKKFGAILGDNVEVGCNSVLNPGTVVGKGSNVYPLSMVRGFVPANSIYKTGGVIVSKE